MNPEDENASKSGSEGEEDQDATVCPMGSIDGDMNELKELLKNMLDIKKEMAVIQEIKTIVSKNTADIAQMQQPRINIANVAQSQHHLVQMEQSENTTGQVYKKLHDLPEYSGSAEDWPLFIANYTDTTNAFQYDNRQNLIRLHKCLTGEAKEAVAPMMIYPEDVPSIIEELQFRFGRPELLIHTQLSKIKEFPKIAYNKPEQIISLSTKELSSSRSCRIFEVSQRRTTFGQSNAIARAYGKTAQRQTIELVGTCQYIAKTTDNCRFLRVAINAG
ncbi:hypothetical protein ACLKA6_013861 [Drosophila palustris]